MVTKGSSTKNRLLQRRGRRLYPPGHHHLHASVTRRETHGQPSSHLRYTRHLIGWRGVSRCTMATILALRRRRGGRYQQCRRLHRRIGGGSGRARCQQQHGAGPVPARGRARSRHAARRTPPGHAGTGPARGRGRAGTAGRARHRERGSRCRARPARGPIAKLWMIAKGSRLTNIKVAINSQNTERCTYGSDLGESQVIVGGP